MPKFMLLLHDNPASFANLSPEEMQKIIQKYIAWGDRMRKAGVLKDSNKLVDDNGKVLRRKGSDLRVTDGPYSETKEILGGYYLVEVESYEKAAELAHDSPAFEFGGAIEVRQIQNMRP
jgi:hypothetical protein